MLIESATINRRVHHAYTQAKNKIKKKMDSLTRKEHSYFNKKWKQSQKWLEMNVCLLFYGLFSMYAIKGIHFSVKSLGFLWLHLRVSRWEGFSTILRSYLYKSCWLSTVGTEADFHTGAFDCFTASQRKACSWSCKFCLIRTALSGAKGQEVFHL